MKTLGIVGFETRAQLFVIVDRLREQEGIYEQPKSE